MPPLPLEQLLTAPVEAVTAALVEPPVTPEAAVGPLQPLSASASQPRSQPRSLLKRSVERAKDLVSSFSLSPEARVLAADEVVLQGAENPGSPAPQRSPIRIAAERLTAGAKALSPSSLAGVLSSIGASLSRFGRRQEESTAAAAAIAADLSATKAILVRRFDEGEAHMTRQDKEASDTRAEANIFHELAGAEFDEQEIEREEQGAEREAQEAEREAQEAERAAAAQGRMAQKEEQKANLTERKAQAAERKAQAKHRLESSRLLASTAVHSMNAGVEGSKAVAAVTVAVEDLGSKMKTVAEKIEKYGDDFLVNEITANVAALFDETLDKFNERPKSAQPAARSERPATTHSTTEPPVAGHRSSARKRKGRAEDQAPPPKPPPKGKAKAALTGKAKAPTTWLQKLFADLSVEDLREWQSKLKVSSLHTLPRHRLTAATACFGPLAVLTPSERFEPGLPQVIGEKIETALAAAAAEGQLEPALLAFGPALAKSILDEHPKIKFAAFTLIINLVDTYGAELAPLVLAPTRLNTSPTVLHVVLRITVREVLERAAAAELRM